jgi:hypothetical protein
MRKIPRVFIALLSLVLAILFNCLWLYLNGPTNEILLLGINVLFLVASLLALTVGRDKAELTPKTGEGHEEDLAFEVQDRLTKLLSNEQKNQDDN